GKTYAIQSMLSELTSKGISAVIFDYTEGFREDQLEQPFLERVGDKLHQNIVYYEGVHINPFVRHDIDVVGKLYKEKDTDVAQRIAGILTHVYDFGDQQYSAVYEACKMGLEKYGDNMNMHYLYDELKNNTSNSSASRCASKILPFVDAVDYNISDNFSWKELLEGKGEITIFQLTQYNREIQVIITELLLWDAWYYTKINGNKDKPFVVVLDEAQNLSHKEGSPSQYILTEGRKFGWSAWFATQSLKVLNDDEVVRLQQAGYSMYFKPTPEEVPKIAKSIDNSNVERWRKNLQDLNKGQCIVVGKRPIITNIASFEER
ncbi:MAG: type IV secretory system conjugative DNA transfer family protein, partial [Lachnospiraceae bacterium]|nr:type IV secretory system conjugative DNA transfer family protein [Lachnospiraceae bacterium]